MTVLAGAGPTDDGEDSSGRGGGYDTRWLDLRAGADDRCRSTDLFDELLGVVLPRLRPARRTSPHLLDLGCGTGAMQRWCDARLAAAGHPPARWTLLDPDEELLALAAGRCRAAPRLRRGTVADLPRELGGVDAVVCSALLDVLPAEDLEHLVRTVAAAGLPLLADLTVSGPVALSPPHPEDAVARAAVDRAATASGATGPQALDVLRAAARRLGLEVRGHDTSWHLDPAGDSGLLAAWGAGYVAAAVRHAEPGRLHAWAADRATQLEAGGLGATVAHEDVLLLPAPAP